MGLEVLFQSISRDFLIPLLLSVSNKVCRDFISSPPSFSNGGFFPGHNPLVFALFNAVFTVKDPEDAFFPFILDVVPPSRVLCLFPWFLSAFRYLR